MQPAVNSQDEWLVGVDAGGTSTRALAVNVRSREQRTGRAGGANWTVHGPDVCRRHIEEAVELALARGGAPVALCLCIAGYYPPDHEEAVIRWAESLRSAGPVRVETDVTAAWAGAFGGQPGIVAISGTGSIVYGRNSRGQEARAGGWGPLLGDPGSAFAVGIAALKRLADEVDGIRPACGLSRRLMARWPVLGGDLTTWVRGVYRRSWGREEIAGLAEEVLAAWEAGDPAAAAIMEDACADLARQAHAVERRLVEEGLPLALQGGLATASHRFSAETAARLRARESRLRPAASRYSPVEGALLLAGEAWDGREGLQRARTALDGPRLAEP